MLDKSPLGKKIAYVDTYSPDLLFPVPRAFGRERIKLTDSLPFVGVDRWNAYEISWLNAKGKPEIALAEFSFPYDSPNIVESKSLKLYLNSFHGVCSSLSKMQEMLEKDLSEAAQAPVGVKFSLPLQEPYKIKEKLPGIHLDLLDIEVETYQVNPKLLKTLPEYVEETVYSDLLKSNCLGTGQPDWGSIMVNYRGRKIEHESLLKYIISFRNHAGFAEHCAEQMFCDILNECSPDGLSLYIDYSRRGGLRIRPFRSNFEHSFPSLLEAVGNFR